MVNLFCYLLHDLVRFKIVLLYFQNSDLNSHDLYYRKISIEVLGRPTAILESNKTAFGGGRKMNVR